MRSFRILSLFTLLILLAVACQSNKKSNSIKILLLSGSNNHEWKNTTPFLEKMYVESGLFYIETTERPDTLKSDNLEKFDVIVSNWNSWPENDLRWNNELEAGLLNFLKEGGGLVFFHASTSAFYKWPEFKQISTGAWIDSTWHKEKGETKVLVQNTKHPVTKGMTNFSILDELWVNAEKNESFEVLGAATNKDLEGKGIENQPAIFVKEHGKGKIFYTLLGHDVRTMRNAGFQTLMLRGTEWAATGKVTQKVPQQLQGKVEGNYKWAETDTTFALMRGKNVVWKYNFNEYHNKPFFHPVNVGRNNITCVSPDDHAWHVGQWFSWKFINGVNYWEYNNKNVYQSDGITEIKKVKLSPMADFSSEIVLDIVYHPFEGENVLVEKRTIKVSAPRQNGNISMDYKFEFEAIADSVDINRTPVLGEPDGQSWGGYGGLSIRFNQDFMDSYYVPNGTDEQIHGKSGDWLYMGFTGLDGNKVGSQIIVDPNSNRKEAAWYATNTNDLPFFYISPAYLFNKPLLLLKGEKLSLNYRINHFNGNINQADLKKEFEKFKTKK